MKQPIDSIVKNIKIDKQSKSFEIKLTLKDAHSFLNAIDITLATFQANRFPIGGGLFLDNLKNIRKDIFEAIKIIDPSVNMELENEQKAIETGENDEKTIKAIP